MGVDEAGMVGSRQLARFVAEAEARGAKIVLIGDHEQLQAIGAGAPFRAIAEQIGHAELSEIRRQRVSWQREASVAFATHRTGEGLTAYRAHGAVHMEADGVLARAAIVRDYLADRPEGTRAAMAHRRADVRAINDAIRTALQDRGSLARGEAAGEILFQTSNGARSFAPGDRIVFLENDRELGVKNGMLGTVEAVEPYAIQIRLDGLAGLEGEASRRVIVRPETYQAIDHGYATTIHKTQGATVDRAFVLASETMDRHLTYVAMTRHRDGVQLYGSQAEFHRGRAGRLVAHGRAPFENDPANRESYFVTMVAANGRQQTFWGVGLERAMGEAKPAIGDTIGLARGASEAVRLPDGREVQRQAWTVVDADAVAWRQFEERLSRSGLKETVLDYAVDFAERRGIAEALGVTSEIEVSAQPAPAATPEQAGARGRSGMFDGLRLNAGRAAGRERGAALGRPAAAGGLEAAAEGDAAPARSPSPFEQALDRFGRAFLAVTKHLREGLPILDAQEQELLAAEQDLDRARAGTTAVWRSVCENAPETVQALSKLSGRELIDQLAAVLDRERAALADPNVRAERFVHRWQELQGEREKLSWQDHAERERIEGEMSAMSRRVDDDPQMETALRDRREALGIGEAASEGRVSEALRESLAPRRTMRFGPSL
jgi:hypothetical protein